ncbi:MAG: nuclear transport factor 2 family protein [Thermohalobaculum sp.]|nr:nuclear transport factor 2 family protein [Thermohalobaculum sp.]
MPTRTTRDVAERLVALCRANDARTALAELYHPDAVSVEAMPAPGMDSAEVRGIDAIGAKHDWWEGAMEVHSAIADGPYLHGDDRFGVIFEVDATERATARRHAMKELGIYTVRDGQVVREEFFYTM